MRTRYIHSNKILISLIISIIFIFQIFYLILDKNKPITVVEPKPSFTVKINECKFDGREEGILSFSFNLTVKQNPTRVPSQIIFQIIDVYKNYSFNKFPFFHGVNLTREYKLEKAYQPEEVLNNVSFVIKNVYKDYMYLPSEYFNYQLFYCEFTDEQLKSLKESKKIFDVLDQYCVLFFDFEHFYKDHMYALLSHPGRQCTVIPRMS